MPQKISITGTSSRSTIMQGINYLYTATGTKLRKQTRIDHQISKTFDYAGRFVYSDVNGDNTELAYLMANHGRIVMHEDGSSSYEYSLKDHLGNTRITFDKNLNILQEDAYYPFGMTITGLSSANSSPENKYKYNGKRCTERSRSELQDEFGLDWYDYGARMYDAELGRWHVPDPLAEKFYGLNVYNYVGNNPLRRIDPDGMLMSEIDDIGGGDYVKRNGQKIGSDNNPGDGKIHIVTDRSSIKTIRKNDRKNKITNTSDVKIKFTTTKAVIKEAINVLTRTYKNGGFCEESSVVTPEGKVVEGERGESVENGGTAKAVFPYVEGENNTSIHSHPTSVSEYSGYSNEIGSGDPDAFLNYETNVIVGKVGDSYYDEATKVDIPRDDGANFYDRFSKKIRSLSLDALRKIIK